MMSFCKGVANKGILSRVPRYVGSTIVSSAELTTPLQNVTINSMKGDKVFMPLEKQPHLNSGLWPIYLAQADSLRPLPLPEDPEKREAPGDANKPPVDPVVS